MKDKPDVPLDNQKKERLLVIFERLLPVIDGLADKLRLFVIFGFLTVIWLVVWCFQLQHYSLWVSATIGIAAAMPMLILARFWWALEELKDLPEIAGQAVGDAKKEFQDSVQNFRSGNGPRLGFLSAGKSLWSIRGMAFEVRELLGSYLSIATLVNPFMLVLALLSMLSIVILSLTGIVLAIFSF